MIVVPLAERALEHALALGSALLAKGALGLAVSALRGPSVILGQHQHTARVLDVDAAAKRGVTVARRATAGTAMVAGGEALFVSLALPQVNSLFPDATFRSILNRNVRPLLRGLTSAGVEAHYFGREWVSAKRRAVAVLGFDVTAEGAVLVEALMGMDAPVAVPADIASADERAVDRYKGHPPAALRELVQSITTERLGEALIAAYSAAAKGASIEGEDIESPFFDSAPGHRPPEGASLHSPERIPIGWLERASLSDGKPWIGGDVLAPRWLLDKIAQEEPLPADLPLDGVKIADLTRGGRS